MLQLLLGVAKRKLPIIHCVKLDSKSLVEKSVVPVMVQTDINMFGFRVILAQSDPWGLKA